MSVPSDDASRLLRKARALRDAADAAERQAVRAGRAAGWSWRDLAGVLGVRDTTVMRRWQDEDRAWAEEDRDPEWPAELGPRPSSSRAALRAALSRL